jgi:putative alpha-1,2-mannosidase
MRAMGGKKAFTEKLWMIFEEGYYDPTNEPDIAYPYLFSRVKGEEWRTQQLVKQLLEENYTTAPDGLPGNDDTGTMSTWAVFSMMGLYPDCPGEPYYTITTPLFDTIEIDTPGGVIRITTEGEGDYIESMMLGDRGLAKYRISHDELMKARSLNIKRKNRN